VLAEFLLEQKQELVRQVERRAAADEGHGQAERCHSQVNALVEELVETLQRADGSRGPPAGTGRDAALQCLERSLIRDETVSEVVSRSLQIPPREMAILSDWASASNERAHRLSDLLDDSHEAAVIISPDGRIEYLNRAAALFVHEATGVRMDQLLGKTGSELGLPEDIDFSLNPERIQALARQRGSREEFMAGRWWKTRYRAISSANGDLAGIAVVLSDINEHKRAEVRVELLARLSAMVGSVDYEDVCNALASVPVPELADWCAVNLVEDGRITLTSVSQSDPSKVALRDAIMRAAPEWNENPLWKQMKLTRGFQLLTDISDEWLRKVTVHGEQYDFMKQVGVQSVMVQPVVSRRRIVAIMTLMYTAESGRRYGLGDPEIAGEIAPAGAGRRLSRTHDGGAGTRPEKPLERSTENECSGAPIGRWVRRSGRRERRKRRAADPLRSAAHSLRGVFARSHLEKRPGSRPLHRQGDRRCARGNHPSRVERGDGYGLHADPAPRRLGVCMRSSCEDRFTPSTTPVSSPPSKQAPATP
jgi:PAS domain S-box-containing protein